VEKYPVFEKSALLIAPMFVNGKIF